jgi:hypothetical protein
MIDYHTLVVEVVCIMVAMTCLATLLLKEKYDHKDIHHSCALHDEGSSVLRVIQLFALRDTIALMLHQSSSEVERLEAFSPCAYRHIDR